MWGECMNNVTLAWKQISGREWRAYTVAGTVKVISNTYPRWYEKLGMTTGYTVYFRGSRVGWFLGGAEAGSAAAGIATAKIMKRTKGRLAQ